jgi:hemolysin activation/secretion protein
MACPHAVVALRHALCSLRVVGCWLAVLLLAPTQALAQSTAAAAVEPTFGLFEFRVEGNSVLPVERIERAVYPFLGERRTVADVESARVALEAAYRDAGYATVVVDTPEQRIVDGVVTLQVVQAPVSRLRVVGAKYFSQDHILAKVPALAEGEVPNFTAASAQLATVNRSADRRVTPLLRPGKVPGTTEVDLTVEDQVPLHGSLELNNRASRDTSATRLQASLSYDNLFQREHRLGLQAVLSPERPREVKVLSASYTVPAGIDGADAWVFSTTRSDSKVEVSLGGTTLLGKGTIFGLRRSFTLSASDTEYHVLTLGADYKDLQETVAAAEGAGFSTPITYLPLSAAWTGVLRAPGSDWQFGATVTGGLRGLVNRQSEFADKRYLANASYLLWRAELKHNRTLPWFGMRLRAQVDAQLTDRPLISNEQFVVGGADSVRGYLESEAVGDIGLRTSVQLSTADSASKLGWANVSTASAHVFMDAAAVELRKPLPGQLQRFGLLGAGFGAQLSATSPLPWSLALDVAWPLRKRGNVGSEGLRVHASALVGF